MNALTDNTPTWTTALPDWEERIVQGKSLLPCKPLFDAPMRRGLGVFCRLKVTDLIGQPTFGEISKPWVLQFVAAVFGAYDPNTRRRLIKEFFLLISKKNTKSTLAAGIMLTALILNERPSCELAIIAPTKEVANNSFSPLKDMILADEELKIRYNISEHTKTITDRANGATLKVLAAESDTLAGVKATYVLIDELWVFGKRPRATSMLQEATGGLLSRPEGFVINLTTMSDEPPAGIMKEKLDYARAVRDGEIVNPRWLGVLYEFPKKYLEDESYLAPENWYITNPNLGASVDTEELQDILQKAANSHDKNSLQTALAKHLNVQIGISLRANRWAAAEFWEQAGKSFTLDELIAQCEVITMGGDGGGLDDLLGGAVLGRLKKPRFVYNQAGERVAMKQWLVWVRAWCTTTAIERRKSNEAVYQDFANDGDLVIVEHIGDDAQGFAQIARKVYDSGKLDRVGLDPHGSKDIADALIAIGIPADRIVGISQGWQLGGHQKTCERKIASGDMYHANQPIMRWCVGNARVKLRGAGVQIDKAESGTAKIDPVIAMLNAVALMSENPNPPRSSDDVGVYF